MIAPNFHNFNLCTLPMTKLGKDDKNLARIFNSRLKPQISKGAKIDCLSFAYVPNTSAAHNRLLFFLFLLRPFTVLMKKTRAVKQSIILDVYDLKTHVCDALVALLTQEPE